MTEVPPPRTGIEVVRRAQEILSTRMPAGWSIRTVEPPHVGRAPDGLLEVRAPDGRTVMLVIEAKRVLEGRDLPWVSDQLDAMTLQIPGSTGVAAAQYLSPQVRTALVDAGLSYVDATGNVHVETGSPGLFLSDRGADRDPWRSPGRPRGTLKGAPAARIVRALADFARSWSVRELVSVAEVSTGAGYRVVDFLEREGLATRDDAGKVSVSDWARMLRRWSDDYGFVRSNHVSRWIAPRGLPWLMRQAAKDTETTYAFTGTLAAAEWAEYAPARSAMIYTPDAARSADAWGLRPTEAGANVLLAEPAIDVVFDRALTNEVGVYLAAPSQVVVDLMTGPGRSPAEAEELLEWMKRNETFWRT